MRECIRRKVKQCNGFVLVFDAPQTTKT